jgi:hypothetical protein
LKAFTARIWWIILEGGECVEFFKKNSSGLEAIDFNAPQSLIKAEICCEFLAHVFDHAFYKIMLDVCWCIVLP